VGLVENFCDSITPIRIINHLNRTFASRTAGPSRGRCGGQDGGGRPRRLHVRLVVHLKDRAPGRATGRLEGQIGGQTHRSSLEPVFAQDDDPVVLSLERAFGATHRRSLPTRRDCEKSLRRTNGGEIYGLDQRVRRRQVPPPASREQLQRRSFSNFFVVGRFAQAATGNLRCFGESTVAPVRCARPKRRRRWRRRSAAGWPCAAGRL
jgi:hypothetical protein